MDSNTLLAPICNRCPSNLFLIEFNSFGSLFKNNQLLYNYLSGWRGFVIRLCLVWKASKAICLLWARIANH